MGFVDVAGVSYILPNGKKLFREITFRVGEGMKVVLIGANGTGKTTLLRLISGDLPTQEGVIASSGGLGVMRQFIGSVRDETTVQNFLLELAPREQRSAWLRVQECELVLMERDDDAAQLDYAIALGHWGDVGGYDLEVLWDVVTVAALGASYDGCKYRELNTLSGGEQKRLALELLLRGPHQVLLLDEPDNYLDVLGKMWLEDRLNETNKTILFVSHDRELIAGVANRIITLEGGDAWVHGGGFANYHQARKARHDRMAELRRRWEEEHAHLKELVRTLQQQAKFSEVMAKKYRVMARKLERFEAIGPPPDKPTDENLSMRLKGERTALRALTCTQLELTGLMQPFDLEVFYGDRVGILGANGAGKSHLLRLISGANIDHAGQWRLGARVVPRLFAQTHAHPEWGDRTPVELLWEGVGLATGVPLGRAMAALRRYGLSQQGEIRFSSLSGGQQARFQILLLELSGATMLLLDEPTDNLDLISAEALQDALEVFSGTVLAVTHDRWFARAMDWYLIFGADGSVYRSNEPVFTESRVLRDRG